MKVICIKQYNYNSDHFHTLQSQQFTIGQVYECCIFKSPYNRHYIIKNMYFTYSMFSEYFITLEEYRNSMIDKLLK